jgi:hypothetical protein
MRSCAKLDNSYLGCEDHHNQSKIIRIVGCTSVLRRINLNITVACSHLRNFKALFLRDKAALFIAERNPGSLGNRPLVTFP